MADDGWNGRRIGRRRLFTNVRILDATGEYPYTGEVLVQGNRIKQITKGLALRPARRRPTAARRSSTAWARR